MTFTFKIGPDLRYILLLNLLWFIPACKPKGPKIDLRSFTAPDSAVNKAYRYINTLDGSAEFWVYKTTASADGIRLTESHYDKDTLTGFLTTWKTNDTGIALVDMSLFMRNLKGRICKISLQRTNNAHYDWAQYIDDSDPFLTMNLSGNLGDLNPSQADLGLALKWEETLLRHLDSYTLPNHKIYYDCVETLGRNRGKVKSKSGRSEDKDMPTLYERTIYAKNIGTIYIKDSAAQGTDGNKTLYLDTTVDGSKFKPWDN